jgi:flagellar biosynthetic protein FlhB
MMEDDSSRTEPGTPKHRGEARKRGQVARSAEISSTAAILAGLVSLLWLGPIIGHGLIDFTRSMLSTMRYGAVEMPGSEIFFLKSTVSIFGATTAWLGILFGVSLIVGFAQVGLDFAEFTPRWSSLNPLQGIKRIFNWSSLVKSAAAILKLIVIVLVCKGIIQDALKSELLTRQSSPAELILYLTEITCALGWRVALAMIVIAIADYAYQRWHHEKSLRMTKEEVKEEGKQAEGNPLVKGKIRSMMVQRHRRRMMQEVPKATVIVTNPTHVAVALRYDRSGMKAPRVVAKGLRLVAERIKEIARENDVPILENKPLARGLYRHCKLGIDIPAIYYQAVASVLAQVYRLAAQREAARYKPAIPATVPPKKSTPILRT